MKRLLEELFAQYYKPVYSYLYSLSRNAALAEDLASEVFLETVKSIGSFRGESDIKTWLFSIAGRHRTADGFPAIPESAAGGRLLLPAFGTEGLPASGG